MLSEKAVAVLSALQYRPDSDWGIYYLPFGSIYWHDEMPDSLLVDLLEHQHDLSVIHAMFALRLKLWDGETLCEKDQQLWDAIRTQVPQWPLFRRLELTKEQKHAREKAEKQVKKEFETFGNQTMPKPTLNPAWELIIWLILGVADVIVFLNSHTLNVIGITYWYGLILLLITAALFWLKFRPRHNQPATWLRVTTNFILVLVVAVLLLYVMGVVTYYE